MLSSANNVHCWCTSKSITLTEVDVAWRPHVLSHPIIVLARLEYRLFVSTIVTNAEQNYSTLRRLTYGLRQYKQGQNSNLHIAIMPQARWPIRGRIKHRSPHEDETTSTRKAQMTHNSRLEVSQIGLISNWKTQRGTGTVRSSKTRAYKTKNS